MSFQKGLREIWDDLMSYRTLKVVKISDARLSYVHKSLMASILVYSTISMIGFWTAEASSKISKSSTSPEAFLSHSLRISSSSAWF